MINKKALIKRDFKFDNFKKDIIELKFLSKVSKKAVFISKKTGLIYHDTSHIKIEDTLKIWSTKIFSKINDAKNNLYNDDIPYVNSRHHYVLDTLRKKISLKKKNIFYFGFGQGGFLTKISLSGFKNLTGSEISKKNIILTKNRFRKLKLKLPNILNSNIENINIKNKTDIGILSWTLCNCNDPMQVVESLSKNIKKNGYLIVAESSRILVPFKKSIYNYFLPNKIDNIHPWHFSFNSLNNIFKYYGFELFYKNKFEEDNNLVLIFKNSKNYKQKIIFDNYRKVISFLKRWVKESNFYKEK
tara:strand:+ start:72 stop:974 length:903 start_codon:yes stop_codon:yes gene_type:complete